MAGTPSLFAGIGAQLFDNAGNVLTGGKIFSYEAGTTTPVATYTTEATNVAHSNPIILDASGRVPSGGEIWLRDGDLEYYKFILKDANDVLIATYDFVPGTYAPDLLTDLANNSNPALGDALIGFRQSNTSGNLTGAVGKTVHDKLQEFVSVKDFGAVGDGVTEDSAAIRAAIASSRNVIVPTGTYRCDTMIELDNGQSLSLQTGATLRRLSAYSSSTDPVIWIKGNGISLIGAGQASSGITTQNRSPNGVVLIGHFSMSVSHSNVLYNTVSDLLIEGSTEYGQIAGNPDAALHIQNPQINGLAVYFQNLTNLLLSNANYGLWLHGWANGNLITNVHGYKLGNTTLGLNKNVFVYCNGALDNSFTNAFFHFSPDSIGLLVDSLDNIANGSPAIFTPYANSFKGLVFEQGGASALGLKCLAGTNSYYEIKDNVSGGNQFYSGFLSQNLLFDINASNNNIATNATTRNSIDTSGAITLATERYISLVSLAENTTYKIVDVPIGARFTGNVEIDFCSEGTGGIDFQGAGKVVYQLTRTTAGTLTSTAILSRYSGTIAPCVPIISGGTVSLVFVIPNNGTAATGFSIRATVKVISYFINSGSPIFYTSATVSSTPGVALANNI